jgi:hypothetical protein
MEWPILTEVFITVDDCSSYELEVESVNGRSMYDEVVSAIADNVLNSLPVVVCDIDVPIVTTVVSDTMDDNVDRSFVL